ncbi:MAG TPA: PIN domain-containing protein [Vicinamibacterales bacterium]|nr:PIN domain-containing protein [Vicinamibacterales bacterium]
MIHLDTSLLVDALAGQRRSAPALKAAITRGDRMVVSTLVLYEWRRGPRIRAELEAQEALWPSAETVAFDAAASLLAAELYTKVARPRGREIDLAIAACAVAQDAALWTLNRSDFSDIPGLSLYDPDAA